MIRNHSAPTVAIFLTAALLAALGAPGAAPADEPKPAVTADVKDFAREVYADTRAALKKYEGKKIQLTGLVSSATPYYNPRGFSLDAGLEHRKLKGLVVSLNVELQPELVEAGWLLARKQKVSVTGELTAAGDDAIVLGKATFKELEANPIPVVKSVDLAEAFAKDQKAAGKKYGNAEERKDVFVEGKILEITDGKFSNKIVKLEGSGKVTVMCPVRPVDVKDLKAGDSVRIKGDCRGLFKGEKGTQFVEAAGHVVKTK